MNVCVLDQGLQIIKIIIPGYTVAQPENEKPGYVFLDLLDLSVVPPLSEFGPIPTYACPENQDQGDDAHASSNWNCDNPEMPHRGSRTANAFHIHAEEPCNERQREKDNRDHREYHQSPVIVVLVAFHELDILDGESVSPLQEVLAVADLVRRLFSIAIDSSFFEREPSRALHRGTVEVNGIQ